MTVKKPHFKKRLDGRWQCTIEIQNWSRIPDVYSGCGKTMLDALNRANYLRHNWWRI